MLLLLLIKISLVIHFPIDALPGKLVRNRAKIDALKFTATFCDPL